MTNLVVVYLASPIKEAWQKWTRLDCLCASIKLVKRFTSNLPIIVFHEDYGMQEQQRILSIDKDIILEQVDFSTHHNLYINHDEGERVGSYGYKMMNRFFSGIMQSHKALLPYSHYMRLDDDSYIVYPIEDSYLNALLKHDYVYSSVFESGRPKHEFTGPWNFTMNFLRENNIPHQDLNWHSTEGGKMMPYTNFHISSMRMWNHPIIKSYTDQVESMHGCVKLGWDDAQLGGTVSILTRKIGLSVIKTSFPYRHNQHCLHSGNHNDLCFDGVNPMGLCWGPPTI